MFDRSTVHRLTTLASTFGLLLLSTLAAACHRGDKLPDPASPEYRDTVRAFYMGVAAFQAGDDGHAEEGLTKTTELAPGEPAGWANLGLLALKQREFDAAAQRFEKARSLDSKNSRIVLYQATLESNRGNVEKAVALLRQAVELDPKNLRAIYSLSQETERQGGEANEAEAQRRLEKILEIQPDNLAVLLDVTRLAAKRNDAAALQTALSRVAALSSSWPQEAKDQLAALQAAASGAETRAAGPRVAFLRNVLVRIPEYRASLAAVKLPTGEIGEPFTRFIKLPSPSPMPSPPDDGLAFAQEPLPELAAGKWSWAGAVALDGDSAPTVIAANGREVRVRSATLNFPGGAQATPPTMDGILALDFNYDFKNDLAFAGAGGFKLYRQESNGTFTDVTARLPASITGGAYWGAWAADVEMDGDLDIVLGAINGPAVVLRNNGDGTFKEMRPFEGATNIRGFVWGDLDGDGDPDAVLLSEDRTPHIFANERGGTFRARSLPDDLTPLAAIAISDINGDGVLDLVAVQIDGSIIRISDKGEGSGWVTAKLASGPGWTESLAPPPGRLMVADLDNNGACDLIWSTPTATHLLLGDGQGRFNFTGKPVMAEAITAVDLNRDGRIDLVGVANSETATRMVNSGTKDYHWQTVRPRAATATGDQRINTFGIGGEMEIRAGLLFQKQPITGPLVHFGLGENSGADLVRISWPNGAVQAEFDLKADQAVIADQRLKGSCPSLFAFDGKGMRFVKDCAPWSPAIGLRINAAQTAAITQTEEWQKIRGDQLAPRDGDYDLRITAELWETFYIDHYALMVVDHPADTDIFVDERTSNPTPKLALYTVATPHPVKAAWDDNGQDVTDTVRALDGRYLDTFGRGQYQGVTRDHFVEVDLSDAPASGPLYLLAHGWLHPTDASLNIAMSQGSHSPPQSLRIEVPDRGGKWTVARPGLGFPSGKNKTLVFDLAGLFHPEAPRRLRLRTNMEIYWDALSWAAGRPDTEVKTVRLNPATAELRYRGFSVFHQANPSSPEQPDYDHIATTAPKWRDLIGYYTRFGDIRELLEKVDDRIVIVNAGDEMALRFPAQPAPPAGWVRDYVLIGDGWIKDGDYNSVFSKTVLPLPTHDRTEYTTLPARLEDDPAYRRRPSDWQEYHTRYVTPDRFQKSLTLRNQAWE